MREPAGVSVRSRFQATEISGWARWDTILSLFFGAGVAIAFGLLTILRPHELPRWLQDIAPGFVAVMALLVALSVLGIGRAWRMGVRIDNNSVIVRNFFRTYRFGWHEVQKLQDGVGWRLDEGVKREWRLAIALRDGSAVVARATSWSDKTRAALEQAAERRGIPAELTGRIRSGKSQMQPKR